MQVLLCVPANTSPGFLSDILLTCAVESDGSSSEGEIVPHSALAFHPAHTAQQCGRGRSR